MKRYVLPGGLWYEGSLGYQNYALNALWTLAEAARHNGIDLYADPHYKAMFDAPLALAMQDGSSPGFNDNPGGKLATYSDLYEIAYARWHDPRYGRAAQEGTRATLPALLYGAESLPSRDAAPLIATDSVLLKEAGYAALRSPSVTAVVRFGLHGLGHGHPDKLNVVTSAFNQTFGLDPGSVNYGAPLHAEWYRSTIAHNTVCVDQTLQANEDGEFLNWRGDNHTRVQWEGSANRVYPGVSLTRSLQLQGAVLDDRFHCRSASGPRTFDWAFHAPGVLTTSLALEPHTEPLGPTNGYQHISKLRRARTDHDWWIRWQQGNTSLTIEVKAEPGTIVFTGEGPGRDAAVRVPLVIIRRTTADTTFAARHLYRQSS